MHPSPLYHGTNVPGHSRGTQMIKVVQFFCAPHQSEVRGTLIIFSHTVCLATTGNAAFPLPGSQLSAFFWRGRSLFILFLTSRSQLLVLVFLFLSISHHALDNETCVLLFAWPFHFLDYHNLAASWTPLFYWQGRDEQHVIKIRHKDATVVVHNDFSLVCLVARYQWKSQYTLAVTICATVVLCSAFKKGFHVHLFHGVIDSIVSLQNSRQSCERRLFGLPLGPLWLLTKCTCCACWTGPIWHVR